LFAATDLARKRDGGRQVVACQMSSLREIAGPTIGPGPRQGRADAIREQTAEIGDHYMAAGTQNPHEFRKDGGQFRYVRERQGADNGVDMVVGERQVMQVGLVELTGRDLGPGPGEHVWRDVHSDDLVAEACQVLS